MLSAKAFAGRFCRLFFWRFRLSGETGGKTMETGSEEKEECPLQCCCNQHVFAPRKARPFVRLATRLDENFQGGYTPQQIRSAYDFPANSTGLGQTIALITTGLQPNIESDLSFFETDIVFGTFAHASHTLHALLHVGPIKKGIDRSADFLYRYGCGSNIVPKIALNFWSSTFR